MRARWQGRVTVDPDRHHGEPCITGTRIPVSIIVGSIADRMTTDELIVQYPQLTPEDIDAALAYAADDASPRGLRIRRPGGAT